MHSPQRRLLVFTVVLGTAFIALGAPKDPLIGNWVMDPGKSTFNPGPVPDERTMTFEPVENGFKNTTKSAGAFGSVDDIVYTVKYDGKDYPASPLTPLDTVSLKRIDAHTIERIGKAGGKEVEITMFKLSPGDKVLTLTVKGSTRGLNYSSVQVYNRQ